MSRWGLGLEARGRYLLVHQAEEFEEWGGSLALEWDADEVRLGPWLQLAPTWGDSSSGAEALWRSDRLLEVAGGGSGAMPRRRDRVEMNLGYGMMTSGGPGGPGLLTTWGGLSTGEGTTYRMGASREMGQMGDVSLEVEREARHQSYESSFRSYPGLEPQGALGALSVLVRTTIRW